MALLAHGDYLGEFGFACFLACLWVAQVSVSLIALLLTVRSGRVSRNLRWAILVGGFLLVAGNVFLESSAGPLFSTPYGYEALIGYLLYYVPWIVFGGMAFWADANTRARCSLQPECCGTCHYNLTGNISGVCSECGTPIPETQRK